jgi:hypothetical protein
LGVGGRDDGPDEANQSEPEQCGEHVMFSWFPLIKTEYPEIYP